MTVPTLPEGNLRLAIPKKGRLFTKCESILAGAGITYRREARLDVAVCSNLPLTLVFLPAADIAAYVGEGDVDLGITGQDVVQESHSNVETLLKLGFGKCKLCVQAPVAANIGSAKELAGKRICTSFPEIAKEFFAPLDKELNITTEVKYVSGSVEAACGLGLASGVVDLVETGTTMRAAGLHVVEEIMGSEAVLISGKNKASSPHATLMKLLCSRIDGYITATKHVMITYNVPKAKLELAVEITPGKSSPTVQNLADENMCSVSSLVLKNEASKKMDELTAIGATAILLFAIENSRM